MRYPRHFGEYLLLEHLGTGGMSEVDLARREVAKGAYVRFMVIKRISAKNLGNERHIRMFQETLIDEPWITGAIISSVTSVKRLASRA